MSTLRIFIVTIVMITWYYDIFLLGVYAQSEEDHSINSLIGTFNRTLNSIREGLSDLPKNFEYAIDIDAKEVFRNSTVKENVLNRYEPTEYSIPLLNYNLLGFNISATDIIIQTDLMKMQDNKTMIKFPVMIADDIRVNSSLTDLSFNSMDLSSIYVIYDPKVDELTVHIPIMTAVTYLPQRFQ